MPRVITKSKRSAPGGGRPFLAPALLCLAVAAIAAWLFARSGAKLQGPAETERPSVAGRQATPRHAGDKPAVGTSAPALDAVAQSKAQVAVEETAQVAGEKAPAPHVGDGAGDETAAPNLPIHDPEQKKRDRMVFDSATERIISGLANTKRGFVPPPLFQLPAQENILDILDRDIVVYEDDDERTVALKENCASLKQELKRYIAEGGTAENFLSWYHNELTKDYNTWKDAQMYIVELMKQGLVEEAEEYMAKANESLGESKIRLVAIPDNLRKLGEKNRKNLEGGTR